MDFSDSSPRGHMVPNSLSIPRKNSDGFQRPLKPITPTEVFLSIPRKDSDGFQPIRSRYLIRIQVLSIPRKDSDGFQLCTRAALIHQDLSLSIPRKDSDGFQRLGVWRLIDPLVHFQSLGRIPMDFSFHSASRG